jgi:regulator of sirC expression with transglutaminase-like and TPR domain
LRGFERIEGYRLITRLFQTILRESVAKDAYARAEKQMRAASQRAGQEAEAQAAVAEKLGEPWNDQWATTKPLDVLSSLGEYWREHDFQAAPGSQDPDAYWLHVVLERRHGDPLALAVLFAALCARLGLKAGVIAVCNLFLVRVDIETPATEGMVLLDPSHGVRPMDLDDCRRLADAVGETFRPEEHLRFIPLREVLCRMCQGLISACDARQDLTEAERVATVLTYLMPDDPLPRVVRAEHRLRRGDYRQAREDLVAALSLGPQGHMAYAVMRMLKQIDYEHPF